jgi:hypothetical protein
MVTFTFTFPLLLPVCIMKIQACSNKIHFTCVVPSYLLFQNGFIMQVSSPKPGRIYQLLIRST